MSRPQMDTLPEVFFVRPERMLMKVDLPAPLGPSRPKIEPRGIDRSMPFSACMARRGLGGRIGLDQAARLDGVVGKVHWSSMAHARLTAARWPQLPRRLQRASGVAPRRAPIRRGRQPVSRPDPAMPEIIMVKSRRIACDGVAGRLGPSARLAGDGRGGFRRVPLLRPTVRSGEGPRAPGERTSGPRGLRGPGRPLSPVYLWHSG